MKIDGGFISEVTESELYQYYLTREMYEIMSFPDYVREFKQNGCNIIADE